MPTRLLRLPQRESVDIRRSIARYARRLRDLRAEDRATCFHYKIVGEPYRSPNDAPDAPMQVDVVRRDARLYGSSTRLTVPFPTEGHLDLVAVSLRLAKHARTRSRLEECWNGPELDRQRRFAIERNEAAFRREP